MVRGLLLALSGLALTVLSASCGGGDDNTAAAASPSQQATAASGSGTPAAGAPGIIPGPASRYSLLHDDLGKGFLTDIKGTYVLTIDNYSGITKLFPSKQEGAALLTKWGYLGGYETAVTPEGGDVGVLQGAFVIKMEVHLFKDPAGAKDFYAYELQKVNPQAQPVKTDTVGDESSTNKLTAGKVGNSTVDQAIHQLVFRRSNLVAIVLTIGAEPFMKSDSVVALGKMIDEKALGKRLAPTPTPTSNFTPPSALTAAAKTPTAAGQTQAATQTPTPAGR
ncbi:MAG: hypothetical protein HYX53_14600 [Chloroflexi bacterium]|nr:hypothetical protein [Chloroflexota bacterium]